MKKRRSMIEFLILWMGVVVLGCLSPHMPWMCGALRSKRGVRLYLSWTAISSASHYCSAIPPILTRPWRSWDLGLKTELWWISGRRRLLCGDSRLQ